ncbi:MAG TPA: sigma-70 family RNA polymerase sigma factor [Mobilitalea sp.]|nr:sigma-70 family RNA polymerase sigma factor [Mobilitalea sp.]
MQKDKQNDASWQSSVHEIEALIREYGNDVLRTAYMYVKDIHVAEDIFQEVFIKVYNNLSTFVGNSSIKTWIIRITINTCKDYLKSAYNRRVVPMMEYHEETISSELDYNEVEKRDTNHLIKEAVLSLPAKYRDVVMCVYFNDMSIAEAAKVLDIAEGTAKSRLARARQKLKDVLEGRVSDEF